MNKAQKTQISVISLCLFTVGSGFMIYENLIGKVVRWPVDGGPTVPFYLDENSLDNLNDVGVGTSNATRVSAVKAAAEAYNYFDGSAFHFQYNKLIGSEGRVRGVGGYLNCAVPLFKGNMVFASKREQHPSTREQLAVTYVYACAFGRDIIGFDMEIFPEAVGEVTDWSSASNIINKPRDAFDLQGTVTHEFGHALGITHEQSFLVDIFNRGTTPPCGNRLTSTNPIEPSIATMCGEGVSGMLSPSERTLHSDDIGGMQFLYPPRKANFVTIVEGQGHDDGDSDEEGDWVKSSYKPNATITNTPIKVTFYLEWVSNSAVWNSIAIFSADFAYNDDVEIGVLLDRDGFSDDESFYRIKRNGVNIYGPSEVSADDIQAVRIRACDDLNHQCL
jgi:hypothetical protein